MSGSHRQPRRSRREIREDQVRKDERKRLDQVVMKMSVFDLLEHLDAVGSGMAKAVQDYRKDNTEVYPLVEIRRGLNELEAVAEELLLRHKAAYDEN